MSIKFAPNAKNAKFVIANAPEVATLKKTSYRFPFKNLNDLTITFDKKPTPEDWKKVKEWFEYWGDNLCEEKIPPHESHT